MAEGASIKREAFVEIDGEKVVIGELRFPVNPILVGREDDGQARVFVTVGRPEFSKAGALFGPGDREGRQLLEKFQADQQRELNGGRTDPFENLVEDGGFPPRFGRGDKVG